jgi:hypothetical protein
MTSRFESEEQESSTDLACTSMLTSNIAIYVDGARKAAVKRFRPEKGHMKSKPIRKLWHRICEQKLKRVGITCKRHTYRPSCKIALHKATHIGGNRKSTLKHQSSSFVQFISAWNKNSLNNQIDRPAESAEAICHLDCDCLIDNSTEAIYPDWLLSPSAECSCVTVDTAADKEDDADDTCVLELCGSLGCPEEAASDPFFLDWPAW